MYIVTVGTMDTNMDNRIQSSITQVMLATVSNLIYGNILQTKTPTCFLLYLQNANGIYKANSWEAWKLLTKQAKHLQIDVLCLTETNMKWNPKLQQIASSLVQKSTKNCQMSTSSHNGFSFGLYQPGGTATAVLGNSTG
jgi:hypothetical protein